MLLNYVMGTDITHVPYRGTGPAMQDLSAGRIDFLCEIITTAKPQIDGGTVKALAIMNKERSPALPNLPTALEQGTKDLEAYTWNAIFLPKGTPEAIVKKLNAAIVAGHEHAGGARPPAEPRRADRLRRPRHAGISRQVPQDEIEKWAAPIKASGVTVD